MLTVSEVAARLKVSKATVYRMMRRGEIQFVRVGHRRRVPDWSLRAYLARIGAVAGPQEGAHDGY